MAIVPAVIVGASAVGGAAISSSSSKKGGEDNGQALLAEIASKLFGETAPLRSETINQAMQALTTGETNSPLLQQTISALRGEGERQKTSTGRQLTRSGLRDSSVGIASLEDIDRAVANLISGAKVSDLSRLTNIGTSAGFGQTPATAVSAASTLATTQGQQQIANMQTTVGTGNALGNAIALLLNKNTAAQTPTSTPNVSLSGSLDNTWNPNTGIQ